MPASETKPRRAPTGDSADAPLGAYRAKRRFDRTPEPGAEPASPDGASFVVQKHAASRLHWDFRLEQAGVLVSWAVPRGPSLDPADKRLAVHVEDHPVSYGAFEGVIPAGNYGAGTVEIWDRGTWEPVGDAASGLAAGELKFVLHGERLQGRFVLIRLKPRPGEHAENWLLIKEHDEHERAGMDASALEETALRPREAPGARRKADAPAEGAATPADRRPAARKLTAGKKAEATPVAVERTAEEPRPGRRAAGKQAASPLSTQDIDPPAAPRPTHRSGAHPGRTAARVPAAEPEGAARPAAHPIPEDAPAARLPDEQAPQLATSVDAPPDGADWISEVKFDGYRLLAFKQGASVRLLTRNGLDWTHRLPAIARAVARLPARDALLDGELVALQPDGLSSFPALQAALSEKRDDRLFLYLFDLLHLDGRDLRPCALGERKAVLARLGGWGGTLRYSDHLEGDAARVRRQACSMGLEGILCKDAASPYRAGRSRAWQKVKCQGREELIVLGWTRPAGTRTGLGSLHMGFHDEHGALHYAGGVGTGFTDAELAALTRRLAQIPAEAPPGLLLSEENPPTKVRWVAPVLVAEVQFMGWSGGGRLRHAVWLGLREDKGPDEVVLSVPNPEVPRLVWGGARAGSRIVRAAAPAPREATGGPGRSGAGRGARGAAEPAAGAAEERTPAADTGHAPRRGADAAGERDAGSAGKDETPVETGSPEPRPHSGRKPTAAASGAPPRTVRAAAPARRDAAPSSRPDAPTPSAPAPAAPPRRTGVIRARAPEGGVRLEGGARLEGGVRLTHPDRELWPGVTKSALAEYWRAVAPTALPGIAHRPLALVRCPDGVAGEHFFQKHAGRGMPAQITEHAQDGAPYLSLDDLDGLLACTQMAVLELHSWGATQADAAHPDRLVFDLDPGEGVPWEQTVAAALDLRERLAAQGLGAFCRTSGGKGLHVLAPIAPAQGPAAAPADGPAAAGWDATRAWCRAFAETMEREQPERYVASTRIARRTGRILVDWLRNGLGSTAVASLSPRARDGATVAVPLAWREVTPRLDPRSFTVATVPARLARLRADPWEGFVAAARPLPQGTAEPPAATTRGRTRAARRSPADAGATTADVSPSAGPDTAVTRGSAADPAPTKTASRATAVTRTAVASRAAADAPAARPRRPRPQPGAR